MASWDRVSPQSWRGVKLGDLDRLKQENQALRDRLSRLSEASLRISESLELDTVLGEIVSSARALTDAGCSGIVTIDAEGQMEDFITDGLAPEEHQRFLEHPSGLAMWEYLRQYAQPLRLRDLASHLGELGLPGDPTLARSFLGAPINHQGAHIGNFYLGDKETGQEFTSEDEEVLALFASQAGAAIANARKHRDEQRARADLEALIDTSPVGVVVFDARSGRAVSSNREARRIVGGLRVPGRSAEELLEALRIRRADGREIVLGEVPLAQVLREADTVRAEEIVLHVPGGKRSRALVNATAIRAEGREVESLVVTLQDLTPREELERLRAEFLAMVSHELQAPLMSIKGCTTTALGRPAARDAAQTQLFFRIVDEQVDQMGVLIGDLLDAARIETGTLSVDPEPTDVAVLMEHARKTFRSGGRSNPVRIDLSPDLPRVLVDRRRIAQVLGNLLTNAARHSPEASIIRVAAALEEGHVQVSVADEGRGVPPDRLPHLFRKFSRVGREGSRRGVGEGLGLAICKGLVEAHGGRIWGESDGQGLGARFTFTVPVAEETGEAATSPVRRPVGRRRGRVLVVDDDPQALDSVRRILERAGYEALATGDPEEVAGLLATGEPDLVLLDLMLPGTDGIELMKRLPALGDRPVIFLSVYGRDETIARALDMGAADYVVKPFSPTELVARIRSALRRVRKTWSYRAGDLEIDREERRVTLVSQPLKLSATEFDLLSELAANAGRVVTYDDLLRRVWRSRNKGDTRVVHSFVRRLRRKLGDDAGSPTYIFTEPRVGYRMPKSGSS